MEQKSKLSAFAGFRQRRSALPPAEPVLMPEAEQIIVPKREFKLTKTQSFGQGEFQNERYGVKVAETEVISVDGLPKFIRTLQKDYVSADHKQAICPIQIQGPNVNAVQVKRQFAIVLLRDYLATDVLEELIANLRRSFEPGEPCIYVATESVLSQLANVGDNPDNASKLAADRNSSLWKQFVKVVDFAVDNGVSDLHFRIQERKETSQISFSMDGRKIRPREFMFQSKFLLQMMGYLYGFLGNSTTTSYFNATAALQCQIEETIDGRRLGFRWAQLPIHGGVKIVMRIMALDASETYTSLGEVEGGAGFTAFQTEIWDRNLLSAGGGIAIAGVVNSGKSKTLQTAISLYPHDMEINTAEDPIEYPINHPGVNQHSTARAISDDANLDPFLVFKLQNKRMDPDVTMVSELRDVETAAAYRDSILAGQRALTTLHAPDVLSIFERLVSEDFGLRRDLISTPLFLKLLVYQALVAKLCPHCSIEVGAADTQERLAGIIEAATDPVVKEHAYTAAKTCSREYRNRVEGLFKFDTGRMRVRNPYGCHHCKREGVPELNGIRGRALVAQMVEPTLEMLQYVRDAKNIELYKLYRDSRSAGFDSDNSDGKTLLEVAMYRVSIGQVALSDAERRFETLDAYEHRNKQFWGVKARAE